MNVKAEPQSPPRRISPEEIELQSRHAAERTELMARQYNERFDVDERHARELAELAAGLAAKGGA